ncbi:MAG: peptidoglycan-associated lipoprotein Pal [Alphaproteobacteria bacterium]
MYKNRIGIGYWDRFLGQLLGHSEKSMMRLRMICACAGALMLAACGSAPDDITDVGGSGTGGPPALPGSETTGTGNTGSVTSGGLQMELQRDVGDRVFFGLDQYDLSPEARKTVSAQAAWLKTRAGVGVTIQGHADERGTREYNLALGERRAQSVKDYLISLGVEPNRVSIISFGKEQPEVVGSNEAAWSQNRRAVTLVSGQ